jgi:hypothetical protein
MPPEFVDSAFPERAGAIEKDGDDHKKRFKVAQKSQLSLLPDPDVV